jgi:addiction module HigA family antidote
VKRENMHNPAHPGELLREYIPAEMSVTEAAQRLGVSRQALSALLNGRAGISAEMDLRLSDALGTTPGFWLRLQIQRDLWGAQRNKRRIKVKPFPKAA